MRFETNLTALVRTKSVGSFKRFVFYTSVGNVHCVLLCALANVICHLAHVICLLLSALANVLCHLAHDICPSCMPRQMLFAIWHMTFASICVPILMFLQMGMYLELGHANFGHQMAVRYKVKKHVTPLKNQEIISRTMVVVSEVSDTWVTREVKGQRSNFEVRSQMRKFRRTGTNDTIFRMCVSSGIHWRWF